MYSVYVYYNEEWTAYYVGKGQRNRRRAHNRNAHGDINVPPCDHIQHFYFADEWMAFECEQELINFWGRQSDGGCLLNQSIGGPGNPGYKHRPETIEKMRRTHTGKVISQEQREKISRTLKGRKLSPETRRKMSEARRGKKRGPYKKSTAQ